MPPIQRQLAAASPPAEWRSRGYLPHFDRPGLLQAITFRLQDSIPAQILAAWREELSHAATLPETKRRQVELRGQLDHYEDAGHGACWLRDPRVARVVEDALLHFDGGHYRLLAWCIMPNHVHALIESEEGRRLEGIVHSWKSFTALQANRLLRRRGAFWFREYHDRYVRDEEHFANVVHYIEMNPVKAGLVKTADQWRFSSAGRQK